MALYFQFKRTRGSEMIKPLGIGSSPRVSESNAMHDSLSTVMLQDVKVSNPLQGKVSAAL
jgi:hypothetical protein